MACSDMPSLAGVPLAILRPMIGVTEGVTKTLIGVQKWVDPSLEDEIATKFKNPKQARQVSSSSLSMNERMTDPLFFAPSHLLLFILRTTKKQRVKKERKTTKSKILHSMKPRPIKWCSIPILIHLQVQKVSDKRCHLCSWEVYKKNNPANISKTNKSGEITDNVWNQTIKHLNWGTGELHPCGTRPRSSRRSWRGSSQWHRGRCLATTRWGLIDQGC